VTWRQDAYFLAKRALPPIPVVRRHRYGTRLQMDLRRHTGWVLRGPGHHEASYLDSLDKWVRPGTTALDVGSNIGLYAVPLAALVGDDGWVVAIEPDPRNCSLLHRNLHRNGARASVVQAAASSSRGTTSFSRDSLTTATGRIGEEGNLVSGWTRFPTRRDVSIVATVVVDELMGVLGLPAVGFVKIDVEGHEVEVLEGMQKTIAADRPVMLIEVADRNAGAVDAMVHEHGYEVEKGPENWVLFPS
jgi:FkbM family methyltransferase